MNREITIAGGGIGGLALARALEAKGIPYSVYEAAPNYANVGGGHWMYENALKTLRAIDSRMLTELQQLGHPLDGFQFTTASGAPIIQKSIAPFVSDPEHRPLVLRRADIIEVLAKGIPTHKLHFGKRVASCTHNSLTFTDGSTASADVLIGADGIHSRVRSLLPCGKAPSKRAMPQMPTCPEYRGERVVGKKLRTRL